jgi:hypothetical protein
MDIGSMPDKLILLAGIVLGLTLHGSAGQASAQSAQYPAVGGYQQPLNQRTPPGVAGHWSGFLGKAVPGYFQPVRIQLPSAGRVTLFGAGPQPLTLPAPAQAGFAVGPVYRLKVSHLPEFPGVELYPSIELLDRLHPPPGREQEFPIPIELTIEEIEEALEGRLVTKVVYLEQPQLADPRPVESPMRVGTVPPHENLLAVADALGRPMVIVRLGGRIPDLRRPDPTFFGTGAPIVVPGSP